MYVCVKCIRRNLDAVETDSLLHNRRFKLTTGITTGAPLNNKRPTRLMMKPCELLLNAEIFCLNCSRLSTTYDAGTIASSVRDVTGAMTSLSGTLRDVL